MSTFKLTQTGTEMQADLDKVEGLANIKSIGSNLSLSSAGALSATDTGATGVEVTGSGNAITSASYSASTRKISLSKDTTFATSSQLAAKQDALTFNPTIPSGTTTTTLTTLKNGSSYYSLGGDISYITTAPTGPNTSGGLKVVVLSEEPATRYDGYIYIITEPALISFTIGSTTYQAEEGMTWQEWCDSEYNINNNYTIISDCAIGDYAATNGGLAIEYNGSGVLKTDTIIANATYTVDSGGSN